MRPELEYNNIKRCSCCCRFLPLTKFSFDKKGKPKSRCKECNKERSKNYRLLNPEKYKVIHRKSQFLRKYGITLDDYNSLLVKQNNGCAICKVLHLSLNKPLTVDHDHETGKVRGLLCNKCNMAIGLFNDNPEFLNTAINYLKGI